MTDGQWESLLAILIERTTKRSIGWRRTEADGTYELWGQKATIVVRTGLESPSANDVAREPSIEVRNLDDEVDERYVGQRLEGASAAEYREAPELDQLLAELAGQVDRYVRENQSVNRLIEDLGGRLPTR